MLCPLLISPSDTIRWSYSGIHSFYNHVHWSGLRGYGAYPRQHRTHGWDPLSTHTYTDTPWVFLRLRLAVLGSSVATNTEAISLTIFSGISSNKLYIAISLYICVALHNLLNINVFLEPPFTLV